MTLPFPPATEIARLTARMLLEIKAVHFNAAEPYTYASRPEGADLYRLPQADLAIRASAAR